jgi:hypothetical protein
MTESKITATDRLRKEGRWEEASLWRDKKRKTLREEGQPRTEANDASWQAMIEQFPPLPATLEEPSEAVELLDLGNYDDQPDLSRDVLWTYENLARKDVTAVDAPSLGAWDLLQWARKNRNLFFERVLPKAMTAREKQRYEQEVEEDPGIEYLDQLINDAVVAWEHEAVADMDATVKKTVKAHMEDWERKYRLDLAPDAYESLSLQMMQIVNQAITAMTKHQAASKAG